MIYLITDGTYTKIGKSKNPYSRINELQTSNANKLTFQYIFNVKDKVEKHLHNIFKEYKTESNNEWFDLRDVDIFKKIKQLSNAILLDECKARFEADKLNNLKCRNKNIVVVKIIEKNSNTKQLLIDVEHHLENKKNTRISYEPYIKKYGLTKEQISFYIKSARLSKKVFEHNNKA